MGARPVLLLLAVAFTVVGCTNGSSNDTQESEDDAESAITNGKVDESDKAAVALLQNGEFFCTGVLISPYVVATAGHCVTGDFMPDQVFFGTDTDDTTTGTLIDVADTEAHPKFNKKTLANDVGVVALKERAPVKPVRVVDADTMDKTWVGTELRLVGFGLTKSNGTAGTKHVGETKIDSLDDATFHFTAAPSQTCQGDSGGPAFATIAGKTTLIGLTSFGDANCEKYGRDTRVDVQTEFINSYSDSFALKVDTTAIPSSGCATTRAPKSGSSALVVFAALALAAKRRRR